MPDSVLVERTDYGALITVNRPEALNALDRATLQQLGEAIRAQSADPEVRVLALTGAGERAFIAGADIAEMAPLSRAEMGEILTLGQGAAQALEDAPQPTIAMVNGYALGGGCELALACDLIIAGPRARFGQPEVTLGLVPGFGGTVRLPRRVGWGRARELILTGRQVDAEEALRVGLCERLARDDLRAETEALARRLAGMDSEALRLVKVALGGGDGEEILARERRLFLEAFERPERRAAMKRFLRR